MRFNTSPVASEAQTAQRFWEALGGGSGEYARLDQVGEAAINVSLGPVAPSVAQQVATGWRMTSQDGTRIITILPNSVSVETGTYDGWDEDFAPRLDAVLAVVVDLVQPVFEQRIGLRYINQISEPEVRQPEGWRGLISDCFLGLLSDDELAPLTSFMRQQAVLQLDEGVRCALNHGFAPDPERDGALTYLLDFDVHREGMQPFDPNGVRETAEQFNAYALRLFQLATTADLREHLGR